MEHFCIEHFFIKFVNKTEKLKIINQMHVLDDKNVRTAVKKIQSLVTFCKTALQVRNTCSVKKNILSIH